MSATERAAAERAAAEEYAKEVLRRTPALDLLPRAIRALAGSILVEAYLAGSHWEPVDPRP